MSKKFSWSKINHGTDKKPAFYYYVYYGDEELGCVYYYPKWKCNVWEQEEDIIMSETCWEEIGKKFKELKKQQEKI